MSDAKEFSISSNGDRWSLEEIGGNMFVLHKATRHPKDMRPAPRLRLFSNDVPENQNTLRCFRCLEHVPSRLDE
ncbi:hypothetical protein HNQ72_004612 [Rhizobium wenxiniae]|uniref:Uncharacterized protein n=1 Tax=Rhizobium wenxiniae TaxID=1737357 RepID=A0A7W9YAA4_9HYPH|nr:hypothetical protein [Rhizobium wenxiniae]